MDRPIEGRSGAWFWLWLAFVPGCGSGDGSGRLAQGAMARAYSPDRAPVRIFFADKVERAASGTRVRVLADAEGEAAGARRRVVVAVQDGAFRGMAGQMERADLRPGD